MEMQLVPKRNRELVQAYLLENSWCELYHHIEGEAWDKTREDWKRLGYSNPDTFGVVPHHIFGGCHRWDIEPNIIAVCDPVHAWCHENRQAATIASIWKKLRDGTFDRELVRECLGFDPIGVLEGYTVTEEWVDLMRMDIFEMVSSC